MKAFSRLLPLLLVFAAGAAAAAGPCLFKPANAHLNVDLVGQRNPRLCWAASTAMAMTWVNESTAPDQCKLSKDATGVDCCKFPKDAKCKTGQWPTYQPYGFEADENANPPLTWEQLKGQIHCAKSPIPYVAGNLLSSHMVVIVGYQTKLAKKYVEINDPKGAPIVDASNNPTGAYEGKFEVPLYDYYRGMVQGSRPHVKDYFNIRQGN